MPQKVIISTDMYGDSDDCAALKVALELHKRGEIEIIAIVTDSSDNWSAPCAHVICSWMGLGNIPIGAYKGNGAVGAFTLPGTYTQQIVLYFGPAYGLQNKTRADYPDSTTVIRNALNAAPNKSVVFVPWGFLTAGDEATAAAADLNLFIAKVSKVVGTCLNGPNATQAAPERQYNLGVTAGTAAAWDRFHKRIPNSIPIDGMGLMYAGDFIINPTGDPAKNPVRRAYEIAGDMGNRADGDITSIYYVARPAGFTPYPGRVGGTNPIKLVANWESWWQPGGNGNCTIIEKRGVTNLKANLQALLDAPPGAVVTPPPPPPPEQTYVPVSTDLGSPAWAKINAGADATSMWTGGSAGPKYTWHALSGGKQTVEAIVKAGAEMKWFDINFYGGVTNRDCYFDLTLGRLGAVGPGAVAAITSIGNGEYLCQVTSTIENANAKALFVLAIGNNALHSAAGQANQKISIRGVRSYEGDAKPYEGPVVEPPPSGDLPDIYLQPIQDMIDRRLRFWKLIP